MYDFSSNLKLQQINILKLLIEIKEDLDQTLEVLFVEVGFWTPKEYWPLLSIFSYTNIQKSFCEFESYPH